MEKMVMRFDRLENAAKNEIEWRYLQLRDGLITAEEFLCFSARIKSKQEKIKLFILKTAFK